MGIKRADAKHLLNPPVKNGIKKFSFVIFCPVENPQRKFMFS